MTAVKRHTAAFKRQAFALVAALLPIFAVAGPFTEPFAGADNFFYQNPGERINDDPFAALPIAEALNRKSAELTAQHAVGATIDTSDSNHIKISVTPGITNVLHLNRGNAGFLSNQNSNIHFLNMTDDTRVIVNVDTGSGLTFRAKNQSLSSSLFDNVIWNFTGNGDITFANSVSTFKGSILAADRLVNWQANDIDGQLLVGDLSWQHTSQSHYYQPWSPGMPPLRLIPEPSSWMLFGLGLALSLVFLRRRTKLQS